MESCTYILYRKLHFIILCQLVVLKQHRKYSHLCQLITKIILIIWAQSNVCVLWCCKTTKGSQYAHTAENNYTVVVGPCIAKQKYRFLVLLRSKFKGGEEVYFIILLTNQWKYWWFTTFFFCFVSNKSDGKGNKNDRGGPFKLGAGGDQKSVFLVAWIGKDKGCSILFGHTYILLINDETPYWHFKLMILTKLMTSLKWKNILMSLCAQRMNPNPSLNAATSPYKQDRCKTNACTCTYNHYTQHCMCL